MIRGVIFDLDGVIARTDELHYRSWLELAQQEGIPFDRTVNERLRGISRLESLEIVLEAAPRRYTPQQKAALADRKNTRFRELLAQLTPADLLPGVARLIAELRRRGIKLAVGSSSKNAALILERLGLREQFDAVVDGSDLTQGKPDPQVFLLAARRLGLRPAECLVIEDAVSGVESARRAGMAVFAVGSANSAAGPGCGAPDLADVTPDDLLQRHA